MMKAKYNIGTNEEAARTIISFFWAGFPGEEDRFIASIPQKRKPAILEEIRKQSEHVYDGVKNIFSQEKFICNGKNFSAYEECETYAGKLGMRITNTTTIRNGVYLIDIGK